MFGETHELVNEFPQFKDKIHNLKLSDHHFRRLCDEYNSTTHEVEKLEAGNTPTSDAYAETLKKKRLALKDELYQMLSNAAA